MREVVKYPIITEKTSRLQGEHNQYSFAVDRRANKFQIKEAVEALKKDLTVVSVRTQIIRGKVKRMGTSQGKRPNWKKAVVKIKEGQSLDLLEQV